MRPSGYLVQWEQRRGERSVWRKARQVMLAREDIAKIVPKDGIRREIRKVSVCPLFKNQSARI